MTGPGDKNSDFPTAGKVVVAHPSRVAQADQVAAFAGIPIVALREICPATHVYIIDLDELTKLSELP